MPDIVEIPVVWLQAGACSGCAVSLLNSLSPSAASLVLRQLTPGKHLSLRFLVTVMAGQGAQVAQILHDEASADSGNYILVIEGSLQTGDDAFAMIGLADGSEVSIRKQALDLAAKAKAVVCVGTCSAFGGIPAGEPNPTGAIATSEVLNREGIETPLINVPGCPPHPDWLVGTLMAVSMYGLEVAAGDLDDLRRPRMYYGKCIHETCPRRADFDAGRFAEKFGDSGCLYKLGCKGPVTYADCPTRMWNSGTNWCVGAGSPCHGCVEPDFPDRLSPLYEKIDEEALDKFRIFAPAATQANNTQPRR